jgi:ribosome-binding factor A
MHEVSKTPSFRVDRVASLLQELLGPVLTETLSEHKALVTISKVEVTRDLRHAKVWLSILGGNDDAILKTIAQNTYAIQGEINRSLKMKLVPRLHFALDTSPRFAQHISEIIDQIHKDDQR